MSWLIRLWALIVGFFRSLFGRKSKIYTTLKVENLPDTLVANTVYIVGENDFAWYAALLCPCGCSETLFANMLTDSKPCWRLTEHPDGTVSIHPSIWRTMGCESHFYLKYGQIHWCASGFQER
jgi:hypothetical protein